MPKIPPSVQLREHISAFLEDAGAIESGAAARSELVRLATQRVVREALEQEQTDCIGRDRYVRQPGQGKRNGYPRGPLATAEGRLAIPVPQVREAGTPWKPLRETASNSHRFQLELPTEPPPDLLHGPLLGQTLASDLNWCPVFQGKIRQ